jgi:hypothetical protein
MQSIESIISHAGLNSIAVCHCRRARNADEVIGLSKLALGVYRNSLPEPHPNIATGR